MSERTYLELSEDEGSSHKFYEVVVDGTKLTIRYGRIGDNGQTQLKEFSTPEKARAEATKKIAEKTRKGYVPAVMGQRHKRTAPQPEIESAPAAHATMAAPVLWRFSAGSDGAFGLFVDEARAWLGDETGSIHSLDHDGHLLDQFRLPDAVKCIVADDSFLYAGCDDGNVYDLRSKTPCVAHRVAENVDICWLELSDGALAITDAEGNLVVVDHEHESRWQKKSRGNSGWMVRCDALGVYHGHSNGVTMYYRQDGRELWHRDTRGEVTFGWLDEATVYAATDENVIHRFTKRGTGETLFSCDAPVSSCAAAEKGQYVFAGDDCGSIYCFDEEGNRLWKLATGCGSACSMQVFRDRLYLATTEGVLACVSLSALEPVAVARPEQVETTIEAHDGVVVECFQDGSEVRVRPLSEGFDRTWNVQFPRELREPGARFVVQELREAARGGFYRAHGAIRRLVR